jgi:hypothetical protein
MAYSYLLSTSSTVFSQLFIRRGRDLNKLLKILLLQLKVLAYGLGRRVEWVRGGGGRAGRGWHHTPHMCRKNLGRP